MERPLSFCMSLMVIEYSSEASFRAGFELCGLVVVVASVH